MFMHTLISVLLGLNMHVIKFSYNGYKHRSDLEFYSRVVMKMPAICRRVRCFPRQPLDPRESFVFDVKPKSSEPFSNLH